MKFKQGSEMNFSYVKDLLETPPRFSSRWLLGQNLLVFYELSSLSDDEVMSARELWLLYPVSDEKQTIAVPP